MPANSPHNFDRHERVTSILTEVAAKFIQREASTNPLITITRTTISPDYRRATFFFTTIPNDREQDALIFLKRHGTELRQDIKKHSRLKFIPEVHFEIDYGERHRQHLDKIVHELEVRDDTEAGK